MLESNFTFPFNSEDAYDLSLPICSHWNTSKQRVLIVCQTVDGRDLKAHGLLGDRLTATAFKNCIKFSKGIARKYKEGSEQAAYAIVNFNAKKHLTLKGTARKNAEIEFGHRIHKIIKKLQPTKCLVSGDEAFRTLWPQVQNFREKRGWVHELQSGNTKLKVVSTLDFARLLEKDGQYANLLGFWCRHLSHLLLGKHPHDLSHVLPEPRYIGTIEAFDKLMVRLRKSKIIGVDTETRDLSVMFNAIYTIQFCTDLNPSVGYVLPIRHPMTPWSKEELKYIRKELRKFFMEMREEKIKEMVFFNGMYDLRVIRREFKLPIIWHKAWEIQAGEHLLDENIVELKNFGSKPGNLAAILCSYRNDFYYRETTKFSKAERNTTGNVKPNDPDFLKYAAMDVVAIVAMRIEQIRKAKYKEIDGNNYEPYFVRHMLHQMSDTTHLLSHMREDGSLIDAKYLKYLTSTESPLRVEMKSLSNAFRVFPEAVKANSVLLAENGLKTKGLFGKAKSAALNWALSLSKPAHLRTLFFNVMEMEPINVTKQGEKSVDKEFVAEHRDKNQIVAAYGEYTKLAKLLGTYAKGWLKKLRSNRDSIEDHHLRPDYSFFDVATGRLASKNPSLQTIPSRGKLAKIIKRMFFAKKGYLLVRYDYSAHEVRVWSYVGRDLVLASMFRMGQKLRQAFIQDPTDENKKAIKEKGDLHILNVKRLLNKVVDKDHPLRDAIKAIIFGLIYGKSAATLGEDTKLGDKTELMSKIGNKDTPAAEVKEAEKKLKALIAEDRTEFAQGLIDKIFGEFKKAGNWTNKTKQMAEEQYQVFSPIGRIRHLYAALTGDKKIVAQQVRRGSNAPVQGLASEIGVKAGRLIMETYYKQLPKICELLDIEYDPWELRVPYNRMVHDASYYSVPYSMVIPYIHILQYCATYGVTKAYKDEFNFEFTISPEIELEIGVRDDMTHKWDWSLPNIVAHVMATVDEAEELGLLEGTREEVLRTIFKPWSNKESRKWLQKNFPLLDVADLDKQIVEAIRPIYVTKKKEKCKAAMPLKA
jgi:DNA polymerase I-like protein with 3'-5' exonuclease and polymerase domains